MFTRMIMPQTDVATLSFLRYDIVGIILFFFCARNLLSISPLRNDLIGIMFIGLGMFAILPFFIHDKGGRSNECKTNTRQLDPKKRGFAGYGRRLGASCIYGVFC